MDNMQDRAEQLVQLLIKKGLYITTVESCTGGGLANAITNIEQAREVFTGAKICYNAQEMINFGIPSPIIARHTIHSSEVAIELAEAGVRNVFGADVGIGITGTLSQENHSTTNSAAGTIYIAIKYNNATYCEVYNYAAYLTRIQMKEAIIIDAIELTIQILTQKFSP